jgi:predicted nucleic acid-binding protein
VSAGILDTSVIIDWDDAAVTAALPDESAVSVITLAELAAGPHLSADPAERARRQIRLQQVEALFDPLVLDAAVARSYGQVVAAVVAAGRTHRRRVADLLIAATALANQLPLYTRNAGDLSGLEAAITIISI